MNTYISKRLKKALRLGVISFLFPLSSSLITSCEDVPMPFNNPELPPEPDVVVIDPSGDGTKDNPYNVAGVLAYINTLGADVQSTKDVYVKGVITTVKEAFGTQNGNATFIISDTDEGTNKFTFYRGLYFGNKKFTNENDQNINEDDVVVICGKVVNYQGNTPETAQGKAYLVSLNGKVIEPQKAEEIGSIDNPKSVTEALNAINSLADNASTPEYYFVKGKITRIKTNDADIPKYNNIDYIISDGTSEITVFRGKNLDNTDFTEAGQININDEVIVYGQLLKYVNNGYTTPEIAQGNYIVKYTKGSSTPSGDAKGTGTQADPFNIAAAVAKCKEVGETASTDKYYIKGIADGDYTVGSYKNIDVDLVDKEGSSEKFKVYHCKGLDGKDITEGFKVSKGDEIVVYGPIINYKGNTPETATGAYVVSVNGKAPDGTEGGGSDTPSTDVKKVTVAQFNAAAESKDVWYQITGTVKNLKDGDQYGNFDLEDETGSVYVYGLLSEKGGEKKKFQDLVAAKGIKNGSKITIIANRSSYKDQIQAANAYFVSIEAGGGDSAGDGSKVVSVADFLAAATSTDVWYKLTGTVKNLKDGDQYGNFDLEDSTGSVYVYGLLAEKGGEKKKFQDLVTAKGIKNGSKITIIGNRAEYKGTAQVGNAYFVSIE